MDFPTTCTSFLLVLAMNTVITSIMLIAVKLAFCSSVLACGQLTTFIFRDDKMNDHFFLRDGSLFMRTTGSGKK